MFLQCDIFVFFFSFFVLFRIVLIIRTVMIGISIIWTSLKGKVIFLRVQNGILQNNSIKSIQNEL